MSSRPHDPSDDPVKKRLSVLLLYMPFGALLWPSLGLSLLRASLCHTGLDAQVHYFSIDFARRIGTEPYLQILRQCDRYNLGAEWVFSMAALPISHERDERFVRQILLGGEAAPAHLLRPLSQPMMATLRRARGIAEPFLDECLREIIALRPKVVGFSSEYQQEMASLALAKRIKERLPQTFLVFGGPNCEGVMGIEMMRRFAFVDAVVSGEGEVAFPQLVQQVLDGETAVDLQGVYTRENLDSTANGVLRNTRPVGDLDDLPYVDYDDYFQQLSACGIQPPYGPWTLFETSRACWWGARKPCAFCGVNGAEVSHRVKSGARSLDELRHLGAKYPGSPVLIVDKTLARERFQDLIPKLADADHDFNIFCETRANLSKDQVQALRDAGIKTVQPGIESLSSEILELMGKGVTALQNPQGRRQAGKGAGGLKGVTRPGLEEKEMRGTAAVGGAESGDARCGRPVTDLLRQEAFRLPLPGQSKLDVDDLTGGEQTVDMPVAGTLAAQMAFQPPPETPHRTADIAVISRLQNFRAETVFDAGTAGKTHQQQIDPRWVVAGRHDGRQTAGRCRSFAVAEAARFIFTLLLRPTPCKEINFKHPG